MENDWVRKIVNNWFHTFVSKHGSYCLLHTERQVKFLHLKRMCYFDCAYCEAEAAAEYSQVVYEG